MQLEFKFKLLHLIVEPLISYSYSIRMASTSVNYSSEFQSHVYDWIEEFRSVLLELLNNITLLVHTFPS
jgi:hypothetical protein